jgi:hypothetical protein
VTTHEVIDFPFGKAWEKREFARLAEEFCVDLGLGPAAAGYLKPRVVSILEKFCQLPDVKMPLAHPGIPAEAVEAWCGQVKAQYRAALQPFINALIGEMLQTEIDHCQLLFVHEQ